MSESNQLTVNPQIQSNTLQRAFLQGRIITPDSVTDDYHVIVQHTKRAAAYHKVEQASNPIQEPLVNKLA